MGGKAKAMLFYFRDQLIALVRHAEMVCLALVYRAEAMALSEFHLREICDKGVSEFFMRHQDQSIGIISSFVNNPIHWFAWPKE